MYCPTCKETFPNGAFCAKDGTALVAAEPTTLVGQILADRYRIARLLGEGGMGQVYEAQHLNINKRFALKLLRPEVIGSPQSLQRFRQEAWAASSIGHENIVEIDDFATLPSGQVYLAMEFLDGQSLAERIRDGAPLSVEDAVAVMLAVAHGLAAAHDKGIVHRDMKPENVFLARKSGRVVAKILDFGIAKMTGGDEPSNLTRTGAIFGTPLYMSPEQAKGKPADGRADIYAVGVILYELLTGRVPFGGESHVEILSQHIGAEPLPPSQLEPNVPAAVEAIVLHALAKEPGDRFQSMAALASELETVATTLPKPRLDELVTTPPAPPTGLNAQVGRPGGTTPAPGMSRTPATTPRPAGAATPRPIAATPMPRNPSVPPPSRQPAAPTREPAPTPSGPSGPSVAQGANLSRPAITRPAVPETTLGDASPMLGDASATLGDASAPARNNGPRNAALALLALLLVAGGGYLAFSKLHSGPAPIVPAPATPTPAPTPAPLTPAPAPTPAPSHETSVIVDSVPAGAKILRDGKAVGETPEAVKLTAPTALVLRKDGYVDKPITADPAQRKTVVKLERVKKPGKEPVKVAQNTPKPGEPVDPYKNIPPSKTPPPSKMPPPKPAPPAPPKAPSDPLSSRVEHQANLSLPGGHRLGAIYRGAAAEEDGRSDWYVDLELGKCFTFVGEGGDGVKALYLYLWGPRGRRVRDSRIDTPHAQMTWCTVVPGNYHFQAKVADGQGEYRVGIYTR